MISRHLPSGNSNQQKAQRARGLAQQATETRIQLERQLEQARNEECNRCNDALLAEAVCLGILHS